MVMKPFAAGPHPGPEFEARTEALREVGRAPYYPWMPEGDEATVARWVRAALSTVLHSPSTRPSRARADAAAEERVRLSEQLREIQARLTWHEAWVRFEAPEVGAAYDELVARTRTVAGQSMKDAWLSPPVADDTAMVIPTSVVDLRALADVREQYMAAVEAHLRPRGRTRRLLPRVPRPRRAMPPHAPAPPAAGTAPGAPGGPAGGSP